MPRPKYRWPSTPFMLEPTHELRTHDNDIRSMKHAKRENEHACTCAHARENMSKKLASDTVYSNTPRAPEPIPILGQLLGDGADHLHCNMVQSSKVCTWVAGFLRSPAGGLRNCLHAHSCAQGLWRQPAPPFLSRPPGGRTLSDRAKDPLRQCRKGRDFALSPFSARPAGWADITALPASTGRH